MSKLKMPALGVLKITDIQATSAGPATTADLPTKL